MAVKWTREMAEPTDQLTREMVPLAQKKTFSPPRCNGCKKIIREREIFWRPKGKTECAGCYYEREHVGIPLKDICIWILEKAAA